MPVRIGYPRISPNIKGSSNDSGSSLMAQSERLKEAGADIIMPEQYTGATLDRPILNEILDVLEEGDTLMVTKLDRLARTAGEGSILIEELIDRGVKVHILNMGLIENSTTGRLLLNALLAFAEFEQDVKVEFLNDGKAIAKAIKAGYKPGRKAQKIPEAFWELREKTSTGEVTVNEACAELGISHSTWYRWSRLQAI